MTTFRDQWGNSPESLQRFAAAYLRDALVIWSSGSAREARACFDLGKDAIRSAHRLRAMERAYVVAARALEDLGPLERREILERLENA